MNNVLERSIVWGVVLLSFLCAWRASAKNPITVHKIFHHTAADDNNVELGSFVLYGNGFTKDQLKPEVIERDDVVTHRFFIPRLTVTDAESRRALERINKQGAAKGYTLQVEELKRPDVGLAVSFTFPKNRCAVSCAYIDSIQREKGIVFHVYNQALIQNMKKQDAPIIRTAALHNPPRIFIDPGHGGDDSGAVAQSGITEKEVCLAISKQVQAQLRDLGYAVLLSRNADKTVALDMRTHEASRYNADLVVSIHANAAPSKTASGIEIFFLDPSLITHEYNLSPTLKSSLERYYALRAASNQKLARALHAEIQEKVPAHNPVFKDRGIKTAVSQILLGAARPAALIEIGFLTHPTESCLLAASSYQSILARAIALGIHTYCTH